MRAWRSVVATVVAGALAVCGASCGGTEGGGGPTGGAGGDAAGAGGDAAGGDAAGGDAAGGDAAGGATKDGGGTPDAGAVDAGTDAGGANTDAATPGGADTGGADTGGADTGGADTGGADTGGADTGGGDASPPWVNPWPSGVHIVDVDADGSATLQGDLSDGAPLASLAFASEADIACFPGTQNDHFDGNHVLYALKWPMPAKSVVDISVVPDPGVEVSLYALQQGATSFVVPPDTASAVSCEASYAANLQHTPNPGVEESVQLQNPGGNEYQVVFAVAGDAATGASGGYTLHVKVTVAKAASCDEPTPPTGWLPETTVLTLDPQGVATAAGDLSFGRPICDLSFAWSGQVACFPETQVQHFQGNQVFYALKDPMPAKSIVTITVTPEPDVEVSLYGLQMGTTSFYQPPYVPTAVTCEESHATSLSHTPNPGVPESIELQNPGNNPYNVFFAVAGDDQTGLSGGYTVTVKLIESGDECGDQLTQGSSNKWPAGTKLLTLDGAGKAKFAGDLSAGKELCTLSWASQSTVACFPGTQNEHFAGNHVFYALKQPVPAKSALTITATPKPDVEVSLYGWWMATSSFYVPPFVPSVGACEASHTKSLSHAPNPGVPESIYFENPGDNEYNVFFAVAGDAATGTAGAYDVEVSLVTFGASNCPESLEYAQGYDGWPGFVKVLDADGGSATAAGDLASGTCTDLAFADDSDVACFPAPQFGAYEGHHAYYALKSPVPGDKTVTITATPAPGVDVSLYALQTGADAFFVPPYVPSVLSCEASNATGAPNPGAAETVTLWAGPPGSSPTNVLIGVAGPDGTVSGGFSLEVQIQ